MSEHGPGSGARRTTRRSLLAAVGGAVAATAGCGGRLTGSPDTDTDTDERSASDTDERTHTDVDYRPSTDTYVYVSRTALEAIRSKVEQGVDPWATAFEGLRSAASDALSLDPVSVVDDGAPKWDDPHRFGISESRHDYRAAMTMSDAVRATGLAFWLTGDDAYARKCIDLVDHWCLAPETRMVPNAEPASGGVSIEQWITMPALWYGASLVRGHPYWTDGGTDREAAFEQWVRDYVASIPDPGYDQRNNIWAWRIQTIAGAGSYLDDDEIFDRGIEMWRNRRPWRDYNTGNRSKSRPRGSLQLELNRDDGLAYHVYGVKALTMTAVIARQHGIDLYSYNAPTDPEQGSTLRKMYDFMLPYVKDPSSWKWGKGSNGLTNTEKENIVSVYELAYSEWEDPAYLDVIEQYGRPAYDSYVLGHVTLTHANRFAYAGSTPTSDA